LKNKGTEGESGGNKSVNGDYGSISPGEKFKD
jgi:hypothetical protein